MSAQHRPDARGHPVYLLRGSVLISPYGQRYGIVAVRGLSRSVYYDALDLTCSACGTAQPGLPPDGLCGNCRRPLTPLLIHARYRKTPLADHRVIDYLIRLSTGHPGILRHLSIFESTDTVYAVTVHPGRWGVLVRGKYRYSPEAAIAAVFQVGQALHYLHSYGVARSRAGEEGLESLIVFGNSEIRLADLSTSTPFPADDALTARQRVEQDIFFLCNLLAFLLTGRELFRGGRESLPSPARLLVERAGRGQYATIGDMLTDLVNLPAVSPRPLTPIHGQATHPGKQRTRNEDAIAVFTFTLEQKGWSVPVGLYLVADGMGGHDAGDVASRTVGQIIANRLIQSHIIPNLHQAAWFWIGPDLPASILTEAIREANHALRRHAQATGSDLGSTVTAALIIGDRAVVANVGDSRTYLLRDGKLEQITRDHSLVARLADAGVIRREEIRTHPRRNEIYRSLGHQSDVEVDTFSLLLRPGDQLILCSDGLWEMVPDGQIQQIVRKSRNPQQACDALVEAANRAGGEDNIAVIVVEME